LSTDALISQENCAGIKIINAIDNNGNKTLVIVAVDKYGNDMVNGKILDRASCCAYQTCSPCLPSVLTTD